MNTVDRCGLQMFEPLCPLYRDGERNELLTSRFWMAATVAAASLHRVGSEPGRDAGLKASPPWASSACGLASALRAEGFTPSPPTLMVVFCAQTRLVLVVRGVALRCRVMAKCSMPRARHERAPDGPNLMAMSRLSRTYSASSGERAASQDPAHSGSRSYRSLMVHITSSGADYSASTEA